LCFTCFALGMRVRAPVKRFHHGKNATSVLLNIPPREMWGWFDNVDGYCGECSFQSVALYYGNYVSQEEVRYADGNEELLVAVNDETAAKALRLDYEEWNYNQKTPQSTAFLAWVKKNIDAGVPVISGWYIREKSGTGDSDYDHIMPIVGYESSGNSVSGIYHNDLYLQSHTYTSYAELFATRKGCSQSSAPKRPYDYCLPTDVDYGMAVFGNTDPNDETYHTILQVSSWTEPDWGEEDDIHDKPTTIKVSATVYGLTAGVKYVILRFDDAKSLPKANTSFLKGSWSTQYPFTATGTTYSYANFSTIQSDGTYFFRTVVA
jgi:hypothetical protein